MMFTSLSSPLSSKIGFRNDLFGEVFRHPFLYKSSHLKCSVAVGKSGHGFDFFEERRMEEKGKGRGINGE
ncbi:hypothetical protein HQ39_02545 [Porphyromonas sp. COT-108 OH2963]|nr:hypothetical protein HQ39_02545 [Porphyromonas sp. COT-108 OH2963]